MQLGLILGLGQVGWERGKSLHVDLLLGDDCFPSLFLFLLHPAHALHHFHNSITSPPSFDSTPVPQAVIKLLLA